MEKNSADKEKAEPDQEQHTPATNPTVMLGDDQKPLPMKDSGIKGSPSAFFKGETPKKLGKFELEKLLGRGGMGLVYKAHDEELDRPVALKIIAPEIAENATSLERLKSEAKASARLNHQNIVAVYAFESTGPWPYIVLEYVEGEDLGERLRRKGFLSEEEALDVVRSAAEGLAYAAEKNIVHRDIKPSNLFRTKDGGIKVMDFGLAKRLDVDLNLTNSGSVIGTPNYMAPEQALGKGVDARSDIYSMGCTLFTLLTGRRPFESTTPFDVLMKHVNEPLPIPDSLKEQAGGAVGALIEKMTSKDPGNRHQSWGELIEAIDRTLRYLKGEEFTPATVVPTGSISVKSTKRRGIPIFIAVVAFMVIGVLISIALMRNGSRTSSSTSIATSTSESTVSSQETVKADQTVVISPPKTDENGQISSLPALPAIQLPALPELSLPENGVAFDTAEWNLNFSTLASNMSWDQAVNLVNQRMGAETEGSKFVAEEGPALLRVIQIVSKLNQDLVQKAGLSQVPARQVTRLVHESILSEGSSFTFEEAMAHVALLYAARHFESPRLELFIQQQYPDQYANSQFTSDLFVWKSTIGPPDLGPRGAPPRGSLFGPGSNMNRLPPGQRQNNAPNRGRASQ